LIARTEQPSIGDFFVRGFSSTKNGFLWKVVFDVFCCCEDGGFFQLNCLIGWWSLKPHHRSLKSSILFFLGGKTQVSSDEEEKLFGRIFKG